MSARIEQPGHIERPILFSGEMVRAILEGSKRQTRRVMKIHPSDDGVVYQERGDGTWWPFRSDDGESPFVDNNEIPYRSPYGQSGDFLWVRERQRVIRALNEQLQIRVRYEADGAESGWIDYPDRLKGTPIVGKCLSYGGFRESSRLSLEVTGVRVERLQDISEEDARAEGCEEGEIEGAVHGAFDIVRIGPRQVFRRLWDSINGKRPGCSWAENPWVWCVSFRRGK